jgi:serine/threonine-protein kinase
MGHVAMGFYYDRCLRDSDRALEEYEIALKTNPNESLLHFGSALAYREKGRWQEALASYEKAVELDPHGVPGLNNLATTYSWLRRHEEAARTIERAIAIAPDHVTAHLFRFLIYRSWHGVGPETRRVLDETPSFMPHYEWSWADQEYGERNYQASLDRFARSPLRIAVLGFRPKPLRECEVYFRIDQADRARGKCEEAQEFLEEALKERPDRAEIHEALGRAYAISQNAWEGAISLYQMAVIYALVGEPEEALDRLEYLLSVPSLVTVADLRTNPVYDPLRDHPRFAEILEKYGGDDAAVQ